MAAYPEGEASHVVTISVLLLRGATALDHSFFELGSQTLPVSFSTYTVCQHLDSAFPAISFLVTSVPVVVQSDGSQDAYESEWGPHLGSQERYRSVSPHY